VDHVSALGSDVDVIATEHGVAEIHGLTSGQRAERIIEIAAPEQRESLRKSCVRRGILMSSANKPGGNAIGCRTR